MKTLTLLLIAGVAVAQAPLNDAQRLEIRNAQVEMLNVEIEIATTEAHLKDLYQMRPKVRAVFEAAKAKVTPKGWVLQPDLSLLPEKTPEPTQ